MIVSRARRDGRPGDGRIEHTRQREVIKTADWVIDLGPEGGDKGGEIVAQGTPEQVADEPRSYTGTYLQALLVGARPKAKERELDGVLAE
jgi:hypothetical protein